MRVKNLDSAWLPDGRVIATSSFDESVGLWDVQSGQQTASLLGHSFAVKSVAWSPDGKTLASAGEHGTVRL